MKVALYSDAGNIGISYIKFLLAEEMKKFGHKLDIFFNPITSTMNFGAKRFGRSEFGKRLVDGSAIFGTPNPDAYDCVLLTNNFNKGNSLRTQVAYSFDRVGKKIFATKDTTCFDFYPTEGLDKRITFGVPGIQSQICKTYHWMWGKNYKVVDIPNLSNMNFEKPGYLSKEEFYKLYNIPDGIKIIAFHPDGMHGHESSRASHLQHVHLEKFNKIFNKMGYQVVCKLHPFEPYYRKSEFYGGRLSSEVYFPSIPVIKETYAYELLKYATFSFTSISSIAYENYIYNLPTIVLLDDQVSQLRNSAFDFSRHNDCSGFSYKDFLYGKEYNIDYFIDHTEECIHDFEIETKSSDFGKSAEKNNWMLYGNSKNATINYVAELLSKMIDMDE